jgi:MFS transporter, DHA1 family, multidrug resistance protein
MKPQSSLEYYVLVVLLGGLTAFGPMSIDMYLPSFPAIRHEFGASAQAVQLTVAIYFVGLAVGQMFYGPLADRFGRKRPLLVGLGVFLFASIGCAFATSVETLVAWRVLQALGACSGLMVPLAVVRDRFDARDSIHILSMLILVMGLAPILAPFVGGQLLVRFGWRSVFWFHAGYGALFCTAVTFLLAESLPPERRRRDSVRQVLAGYASLARDRTYMAYVFTGGLYMAGLFAYIAASPYVFIELFHVPPERYGLFFGANAIGLISASQVNGRLARNVNPLSIIRVVLPTGACAGLALLVLAATGIAGFAGILVPLFVFIACLGFVRPNTTALAMAPHGRVAGSASALLGTIQFLLGAGSATAAGALAGYGAVALGIVIAACGCISLLIHHTASRPRVLPGLVDASL